ncbi:LapA family protein [Metabacillus malikii]|uniref:Integral membrane protein n=1 Tax=Metabacillus malikii TaxID=1504265 RepID=A0ABT9ZHY8_9BACI|nr:lipopolysaccharide assembly protein LapA domain-containing protein [Metabacillus malikii]MDQ0231514.1 putative integral membrane protein [Metabacillus malikii]
MKRQWSIVIAILFALIIAIFAVINVEPVQVDYLFGQAEWPLVLIILGSVLMGGFLIATTGFIRIVALQRKLKMVEKENQLLKEKLENDQMVIAPHDTVEE